MQIRCLRSLLFSAFAGLFATVTYSSIYTVTDAPFNAVPNDGNDDSAAFQAAFDQVSSDGEGRINIPSGNYHFSSKVSLDVNKVSISLVGAGSSSTKLISTNTDGVLFIKVYDRTSQVTLSDLCFLAKKSEAGTAFRMEMRPGGAQERRSLTIENVNVLPRTHESHNFDVGISAFGCWRPYISNVTVQGRVDANLGNSSKAWKMDYGIQLDESYAPAIENCDVQYAMIGYSFYSENNPEGGSFTDNSADHVRTGIRYEMTHREPGLILDNNALTARDYGAHIIRRRVGHILNNTFSPLSSSHSFVGVRIEDSSVCVLADNTFTGTQTHNIEVNSLCEHTFIVGNSLTGSASAMISGTNQSSDTVVIQ